MPPETEDIVHALRNGREARTGFALGLLALAHFIISVDFNIVYIALPEIGRQLGFTASSLQWVVSAYALGYGGFLLLGGRLVDRIGARRIFVTGVTIFGVASVGGAVAVTPEWLVAARAGQGIGAALLFPATLALVNTGFAAGAERNRALAVWGVAGASGALAGGAAGGMLTSALGWESVFAVMVPLTLIAALAAPRVLVADQRSRSGKGGFDVPGAITATGGSLLVVLGLVNGAEAGWTSASTLTSLLGGIGLLGVFLLIERSAAAPLMPLRMFRHRNLVASMGLIFVLMGPVTGLHYLYTTHMQDVLGYDALAAGLGFLPQSLLAIAGSWLLLPRMLNRWAPRRILFIGAMGIAGSIVLVVLGMSGGSYAAVLPGLALFGLFAGTAYPALFGAVGTDARAEEQGVASAMASTSQQVGGAVGLAALVAVAHAGMNGSGVAAVADTLSGLRAAGWAAAVLTVAAALVALAMHTARASRDTSAGEASSDDQTVRVPVS